MSIWINQPLEHTIVPKPFTTPQEEDFITELTIKLPEPFAYFNDNATFSDS